MLATRGMYCFAWFVRLYRSKVVTTGSVSNASLTCMRARMPLSIASQSLIEAYPRNILHTNIASGRLYFLLSRSARLVLRCSNAYWIIYDTLALIKRSSSLHYIMHVLCSCTTDYAKYIAEITSFACHFIFVSIVFDVCVVVVCILYYVATIRLGRWVSFWLFRTIPAPVVAVAFVVVLIVVVFVFSTCAFVLYLDNWLTTYFNASILPYCRRSHHSTFLASWLRCAYCFSYNSWWK